MNLVTGIGGFFFRAQNPEALSQWYHDHFGIDPVPAEYHIKPWKQQAGPTVFAPFPNDTEYFGDGGKSWMINFRVRDLAALVRALRDRNIDVTLDPTSYPNGRFARLRDPEGNPVELWEPG